MDGVGTSGTRLVAAVAVAAALAAGLAVASGFAGAGGAAGEPTPAAFRLADGSVACGVDGAVLVCAAAGDRAGVELRPDGSSGPAAPAVTRADDVPLLQPAESWWDGPYRCHVAAAGDLVCTAGGGAIRIGRDGAGGVR